MDLLPTEPASNPALGLSGTLGDVLVELVDAGAQVLASFRL